MKRKDEATIKAIMITSLCYFAFYGFFFTTLLEAAAVPQRDNGRFVVPDFRRHQQNHQLTTTSPIERNAFHDYFDIFVGFVRLITGNQATMPSVSVGTLTTPRTQLVARGWGKLVQEQINDNNGQNL